MSDVDKTLSFIKPAPGIHIEDLEAQQKHQEDEQKYADPVEVYDFYWESSSTPFHLLKSTGQKSAQKLMLLLVICFNVSTNSDHVQDCSRSSFFGPCTYTQAWICAFTKTFVNCFPLLAIMLTIVITLKQMAFKRVFYQALKRKGLLVYEHFNFHHDPDYLLMIFFYFMAVLHFVQLLFVVTFEGVTDMSSFQERIKNMTIIKNATAPDPDKLETAKSALPFYILPGFMWWGLFTGAYDTAKLTLPLMKFFQKEPYKMQVWIDDCKIMKESMAAWVLRQRVALRPATDTASLYKAWIDESAKLSKLSKAEQDKLTKEPVFNRFRMMDAWWPSRILFAARLNDEESLLFRFTFDLITLVSMVVFFTVFGFVCLNFYNAYIDYFVDGKRHTWTAFLIYLLFTVWAGRVAYKLVLKTRMLSVLWEDIDNADDIDFSALFHDAKTPAELRPLIEGQEPEPESKQSNSCITC